MKFRDIFGTTLLILSFSVSNANGQASSDDLVFRTTPMAPEVKKSDLKIQLTAPLRMREHHDIKPARAGRFSKMQFLILSAAVYGASFADMHQTLKERKYPWWYEADPLARPLVKLPAPAYYATGFAMATGLNWISWKMGHSRRWHKVATIPQLLAIGGNTYGYATNRFN
jgi:hypothetical protein